MPKKQTAVALIPKTWLDAVIAILESGDSGKILWTVTAQRDLTSVGLAFTYEACDLCLEVLRTPGLHGERIPDMIDRNDKTVCETWAFLCPHPSGGSSPIYVKIGLHQGRVLINFFSFHIDRSGKLLKAIRKSSKTQP